MAAKDLVVTWEDAYRMYGSATGEDVTHTSRAVARAWRDLAACAELPWWLSAAVRSAAQAFEYQAQAWATSADGDDDTATVSTDDEDEEEDSEEHGAYPAVLLPTQTRTRTPCACAHEPSISGPPAVAAQVVSATA